LKRIDNFLPTGSGEPLFLSLRKPGSEFWPQIKQQDENKRKMDKIKAELKQTEALLQENDAAEEAIAEYHRQKELREKSPTNENGEAWPELKEPKRTQEEISETRNNLTSVKGELEARLAEMITD